MNTAIRSRLFAFLSLSVPAFMLYGCMTATEVRKQIDESNEQILIAVVAGDAADLSGIENPQGKAREDYARTAARIQDFIEQNPKMPKVTNPLRLRLAVLYMVNGQANLAAATFEEVQVDTSLGERDLLIYNLRAGLVWWYELNSSRRAFDKPDIQPADTILDKIQQQLDLDSVTTPALKAWLNHLGFTIAEHRIRNYVPSESITTTDETFARMVKAIGSYTDWWDTAMRKDLKVVHGILPASCPRSGITKKEWQQQIQQNLRKLRQSGEDFQLTHWSLFRWYPLFFCNTEDLQREWLKHADSNALLKVSDWMQCTLMDAGSRDVRCAPKAE